MKETNKEKLAEICGAFIGDGWIESRGRSCYLAGNKTEDKEYYDEHMTQLFKEVLIETKPQLYPYWRVYGIGLHNVRLIQFLTNLGIPKGKKAHSAQIPQWILSSHDDAIKIAFLRGLFDTDGCLESKKCYGKYDTPFRKKYHCQPRIVFTSISEVLMIQVLNLLKELQFHPEKINLRKGGFMNNFNHEKSYRIRLNKLEEIKRWFDILYISANPKHTTKYFLWKKFGFVPPRTTIEERRNILKGEVDIYSYYAGVPEWSKGMVSRTIGLVPTKVQILSPAFF